MRHPGRLMMIRGSRKGMTIAEICVAIMIMALSVPESPAYHQRHHGNNSWRDDIPHCDGGYHI